VTQSCVSIYHNLWNNHKAPSHYFLNCSSDPGTFKKVKWQLGSKSPSNHGTLKPSIASRILTTAGGTGATQSLNDPMITHAQLQVMESSMALPLLAVAQLS
jgi:hypothetical protein